MADNTVLNNGTGGDTIRDLARQAGTIKTQVVQIDMGGVSANAEVLVTAGQQVMAASVPVVLASNQTSIPISGAIPTNVTTSGTLSASDAVVAAPIGDGTLITGASTAGSIVFATVPDGFVAWTLLIKGYTSGAIYTEASNNTTNGTDGDWVEVKGRRTGTAPGVESVVYAMVSNGYYRGNTAGFKSIRARLIGATGATITWVISNGQGATFLNSGIPAGSSIIGKVSIDQTTPGTTNAVSVTNFPATQPVSLATNTPTLQSGSTTAVTQATGTNLHTVVDSGIITTVSSVTAIANALPTGANIIGKVGIDQTTPGTTNLVSIGTTGTVSINAALPTGANIVGSVKLTDGTNTVAIGVSGGQRIIGANITGVSGSIAAAGTGTIGPLSVSEGGNITFIIKNTVAASAYAGNPVVVFEQSDDNVSWGPLNVVRSDIGTTLSTVTLVANTANASLMFDAALEGVAWVRARVTTGPITNAMTINIVVGGILISPTVSAVQQSLTKGVQGTQGVSTQDLKDSGRNQTNYFMATQVLSTATEVLQSLTGYKAGATVAANPTPAVVTASKTYRINRIAITYIAVLTAGTITVNLRANIAGSAAIFSPIVDSWIIGAAAAVAGVAETIIIEIPDGMEFAAGTGLAIGVIGNSATGVAAASGYAKVSIGGFEY